MTAPPPVADGDTTLREQQVFNLSDGRRLGFAEYGDPAGWPLIFFHGTPSSRLMFRLADTAAAKVGARVIAPDRPGIGLSDALPGRKIADIADDASALADHLGVRRYAVAGISGGGPYALACAARTPDQVEVLALISSMAPLDWPGMERHLKRRYRMIFAAARDGGWPMHVMSVLFQGALHAAPRESFRWAMADMHGADQAILSEPRVMDCLIGSTEEAFRTGRDGVESDVRLLARPWELDIGAIAVPSILWHGDADHVVPLAMGEALAARLGNCRMQTLRGAGHFWGAVNAETILNALAELHEGDGAAGVN